MQEVLLLQKNQLIFYKKEKERFFMITFRKELLKKVAKSAYSTAKEEANATCACFAYQPALPKAVKELSKRK